MGRELRRGWKCGMVWILLFLNSVHLWCGTSFSLPSNAFLRRWTLSSVKFKLRVFLFIYFISSLFCYHLLKALWYHGTGSNSMIYQMIILWYFTYTMVLNDCCIYILLQGTSKNTMVFHSACTKTWYYCATCPRLQWCYFYWEESRKKLRDRKMCCVLNWNAWAAKFVSTCANHKATAPKHSERFTYL